MMCWASYGKVAEKVITDNVKNAKTPAKYYKFSGRYQNLKFSDFTGTIKLFAYSEDETVLYDSLKIYVSNDKITSLSESKSEPCFASVSDDDGIVIELISDERKTFVVYVVDDYDYLDMDFQNELNNIVRS